MISYRLSCCVGGSATVPYHPGGWARGWVTVAYRPGWVVGDRATAPYRPGWSGGEAGLPPLTPQSLDPKPATIHVISHGMHPVWNGPA